MILLVTPNLRAEDCAAALKNATGEEVVLADSLRRAAGFLRTESYQSVVLDQYLVETEPDEASMLMEHVGTAIPLQVNLAISGVDRLVREIRAAVRRKKREELAARRAAEYTLHSELNGTVTALLLSCELAMSTPNIPAAAMEKLQSAHELVKKLRAQLQPTTGAV